MACTIDMLNLYLHGQNINLAANGDIELPELKKQILHINHKNILTNRTHSVIFTT